MTSQVGETARKVNALTHVLGMDAAALASALRVPVGTVRAWLEGSRMPGKEVEPRVNELFTRLTRRDQGHDRLRTILAVLEGVYGSPRLESREDPLDELFFLLLSLKTTYRTFEEIFDLFREQFYPWSKLLEAGRDEIESCVRKGGLGSIKAAAFVDIARRLKADFGEVSLNEIKDWSTDRGEKYLTSLPGVGLKTARCVLLYSLGREILPVDGHTYRVGVRLGLVPPSTSTPEAHANFDKIVPALLSYRLHSNFIALGEAVCQDPTPKCEACPLKHLCDYAQARAEKPPAERVARPRQEGNGRAKGSPRADLTAVDIYAGCGGLSAGLHEGGFHLAYSLDWDKHACKTHEHNFPDTVVECVDVRQVSGSHILDASKGHVDLLAGGPNCQGVSQRGVRNPDDPRNFMFAEYVRLVAEVRPTALLMENVPGLAHRHNFEVMSKIFQSFEELGYRCAADVLLAADYGVPQLRYRFVMIGTLNDMPLTLPVPSHDGEPGLFGRPYVTVWDAIGDLPPIDATRQLDLPLAYAMGPTTDFRRYARESSESAHNHICSATESINLDRASHVREGGNWKDIPASVLPDRFFACRMTDHSTTYARLRRDQPAFTITALFGNITAGAFTHPLSDRALSIREGARLQSFRDRFVFRGPRNSQYRQIGNAVPPLLGKAVGEHLRRLLSGEKPDGLQPRITREVLKDQRAWDRLPILTPRFKALFGAGTRWPVGWGPEPEDYAERLDKNYSLRQEFWPPHVREKVKSKGRRKLSAT